MSALVLHTLGCTEEVPIPPAPPQPVKILEIRGGAASSKLEFPGTTRASQFAELAFDASGRLIELNPLEGEQVTRDQVLARLDPRDFENARDAENAKLARAKADYERERELFEADVTSKQNLERAQSQYEVAKANAERALKDLEEDTVIRAPFAGTVAKVHAENFQDVQAKEPIVLLQDSSSIDVVVAIPESALAGQRADTEGRSRDEYLQAEVRITSIPDRSFPARIKEFSPTADPTSRTFQAVVSIDPPEDVTILPGMTASVRINPVVDPGSARANEIRIPAGAALADEQGKAFIWKIDPTTMMASRSSVVLGELSGGDVRVTGGLSSGDWIAVSGVHQLREGMRVSRFEN